MPGAGVVRHDSVHRPRRAFRWTVATAGPGGAKLAADMDSVFKPHILHTSRRIAAAVCRPRSAFAELRLGGSADRDARLLVLAGEFLLAIAGPDLHCDQEAGWHGEAGRDQEGQAVARYQRAGRVLCARCGDGGEHREPGRGAGLLAGGEQRAGQALITSLDAAGDCDPRGRQREPDPDGSEQQARQHSARVAGPGVDLGQPQLAAGLAASPASSTCLIENLVSSLRVSMVETSTTVTVDGTRASPVCSGLKPSTFCRYSEVK